LKLLREIAIARSWDGKSLPETQKTALTVQFASDKLNIEIDAPYHADPPPQTVAGRCDRLWEYEVVELFLVGPDDRYLELEFGPHGHYLGLTLHGVRNVVDAAVPMAYAAQIHGRRWSGRAQLDTKQLPGPIERWNAFAIHGVGAERRYRAAHPLQGASPDFHRIQDYPATILGGVSPQEFLEASWQKQPRLIRAAVPELVSTLTREKLFALSRRATSRARLIAGPRGDGNWSVEPGPFSPERLERLPEESWTLLVNEVERSLPECAALLERFRFAPNWRVDDLMVSYATDGGGVGPHIDRYDVFLLQCAGRRRWRISTTPSIDPRLRADVEFPMLAEFEPDREWLLEPGDMLYLPPRIPHEGVALGESITCSIGFRTPDPRDLLSSYLTQLGPAVFDRIRYADPDLRVAQSFGEIPTAARDRLRERARSLFAAGSDFDRWVGCYLTRSLRNTSTQTEGPAVSSVDRLWELLEQGARLERSAINHFAWLRDSTGNVIFFGEGEDYPLGRDGADQAELLCGQAALDVGSLGPYRQDGNFVTLLVDLILRSVLYVNCH